MLGELFTSKEQYPTWALTNSMMYPTNPSNRSTHVVGDEKKVIQSLHVD